MNPTFVADKFGTYTVQLIVNDGTVNSAPDTVVISTQNSPPVANAGPDQSAFVTQTVQLDGSKSSDVDGNSLTFFWSLASKPSGSSATISDPAAVKPTFIVDVAGKYVAQLIVNDGSCGQRTRHRYDQHGEYPPCRQCGGRSVGFCGRCGSAQWLRIIGCGRQPPDLYMVFCLPAPGSNAALSNSNVLNPQFTLDKFGTYVVQLIVNDGFVNSAPDTVSINTLNSKPVANAGPDQTIHAGNQVFLDGSASSDVDGNPLTYAWSFTSHPAGEYGHVGRRCHGQSQLCFRQKSAIM